MSRAFQFIPSVMLRSRQTMGLVAGVGNCSRGTVPDESWWANGAGIGRRGRLTDPVTALTGALEWRLVQLGPL
ncbi:hypothetical protein [Mycolicibacterium duvalii]|uniref:hypothetical protein n=1 Tax=Mycolicibacterium duvalii TaxID=39688 RepID=UPI0010542601|nr:hypothetical protein [Mycolicibacterium duvalii]MCV7370617.1 hypothetical protein [Mycolicibacterium duvalii]